MKFNLRLLKIALFSSERNFPQLAISFVWTICQLCCAVVDNDLMKNVSTIIKNETSKPSIDARFPLIPVKTNCVLSVK